MHAAEDRLEFFKREWCVRGFLAVFCINADIMSAESKWRVPIQSLVYLYRLR